MVVCFNHYHSSRPRGFYLVSFQKTKWNGEKSKWKKLWEKLRNENEQDGSKIKTKWKQKQNEQNKKNEKIIQSEQKKISKK